VTKRLRSLMLAPATVAGGLAVLIAASAGADRAAGQQKIPMMPMGIPVAPTGLANRPLPKLPMEFDTGEGMRIRVTAFATGLENPWTIAFLPDGVALVTERTGRLRVIRNGKLDPKPVAGAPMARNLGVSGEPGAVHGYMDVVLHPQFATNNLVYVCYTKPIDEKRQTTAIARGRWDGTALVDTKDVFVGAEGNGTARIAFGRDGMLYVTTAAAGPGQVSQDGNSQGGKVLRLKDDGTVPPDNPFVGKPGYKPEVYTLGHRSSLGLAVHPGTGQMWQHENGPNGGDEINILKPGANYGWPLVSYGRTYQGEWQGKGGPGHAGFEAPIVLWIPSIAASGMEFYTGDKLPKWKGDVFVGALRTGEIPGTGHLERILLNEKLEEMRRESLLVELRQRIRDVKQGPDGLLYVLTDQNPGAILRIEPAN
jgi:aldose sugar dehydrogenase